MDNKLIALIILGLVLGLQGVHIAVAGTTYNTAKYADTFSGGTGTTQRDTAQYRVAFLIVAAGISVLGYAYLLVAKFASFNNPQVDWIVLYAVSLLQFAIGVAIALDISAAYDPKGTDSKTASMRLGIQFDDYKTYYALQLADTVLTFVLCIPGSIILFYLRSQELKGSDGSKVNGTTTQLQNESNLK